MVFTTLLKTVSQFLKAQTSHKVLTLLNEKKFMLSFDLKNRLPSESIFCFIPLQKIP